MSLKSDHIGIETSFYFLFNIVCCMSLKSDHIGIETRRSIYTRTRTSQWFEIRPYWNRDVGGGPINTQPHSAQFEIRPYWNRDSFNCSFGSNSFKFEIRPYWNRDEYVYFTHGLF